MAEANGGGDIGKEGGDLSGLTMATRCRCYCSNTMLMRETLEYLLKKGELYEVIEWVGREREIMGPNGVGAQKYLQTLSPYVYS